MTVKLIRNRPIASESINALRSHAWVEVASMAWGPVLARSLGWVCAVVGDGEELVGFVNVAWDGGVHTFLLDTTVHRDYQRRGIGRALVREAATLARERGAEWLHVDYEPGLEGFYRGCGFHPTPAGLLSLESLPAPDANHLPAAPW